jgi:hypothetical protein
MELECNWSNFTAFWILFFMACYTQVTLDSEMRQQNQANLLILLARPTGIEPVFPP